MRNWQRWILMAMTALCAATALWCGALYLSQLRDQAELEKLAEEILRPESSDALPGTAELPAMALDGSQGVSGAAVDFSSLTAQNGDVVAWIEIPGAGISQPIVQGPDNDTYLRRNFYGEESVSGTLFLDYANSPDFSDGNSIIHGHNFFDGSTKMFSALPRYTDLSFWQENPEIELLTPDDGALVYRIFAVCQFDVSDSDTAQAFYRQDFRSNSFESEYTQALQNRSVIQTGETVPAGSRLLTLSTCDRSIYGEAGRLVVVGYLV